MISHAVIVALSGTLPTHGPNATGGPVQPLVAEPEPRPADQPGRRLALLVGISQYERLEDGKPSRQPPDWWNLNCRNDVDRLKELLVRKFQFRPADVRVLTDGAATRRGIEDAFRDHLIRQARPGDVVYFHYSGHGQQIEDDNDDEIDGLDESLVTADYKSQSAKDGYDTNLRDDTIRELLKQLKGRMTGRAGEPEGSITLTFDCCFSGTATRGAPPTGRLVHRGRGWDPEIDGPRPPARGRGIPDDSTGLLDEGEAIAHGYVLLTATRSDQVARERQEERMGAFTFHLLSTLGQATPRTTYRDVFERLYADLTADIRDQEPTMEGEASNLLFSGSAVPPNPYVLVRGFDDAEGSVTLPVGRIQGATIGSRYAIFKAGSDVKVAANRIASAEVIEAQTSTSTAGLEGDRRSWPKAAGMLAARAVETEHNYGDEVLLVFLDRVERPVAEAVRGLKLILAEGVTGDNYDVRVGPDRTGTRLVLERKGGGIRAFDPRSPEIARQVRDALFGEWKWRFVSRLRNDNPDSLIGIDFRLVPVEVETVALPDGKKRLGRVVRVRDDVKPVGNKLSLREGDYVMLEVRNTSERRDAFISVLNLTPTGAIRLAFPDPGEVPRFRSGEGWKPLRRYVFELTAKTGSPIGTDLYKAIGTREETDFGPLLYEPRREEGLTEREVVKRGIETTRGRGTSRLSRLIGMARLGEDPDPPESHAPRPPQLRGERVTAELTDWSTVDFVVEVTKRR